MSHYIAVNKTFSSSLSLRFERNVTFWSAWIRTSIVTRDKKVWFWSCWWHRPWPPSSDVLTIWVKTNLFDTSAHGGENFLGLHPWTFSPPGSKMKLSVPSDIILLWYDVMLRMFLKRVKYTNIKKWRNRPFASIIFVSDWPIFSALHFVYIKHTHTSWPYFWNII